MFLKLLRRYFAALGGGLIQLLIIVVVVEGAAWGLLRAKKTDAIQIEKNEWQEENPTLGYRPKADFVGKERKYRGEETVYDAVYTLDARHRRVSPVDEGERKQFALFFGDSFTFGQGVNDKDTLPAQFGALAPDFRPYNYGCGGYGPQNAWMHAQREDFASEIAEDNGIAVYTYIEPQLYRAVGSTRLLSLWGKRLPYLAPAKHGLQFMGLYEEVFPGRCLWARVIMGSQTVQYMGLDWPSSPPEGAYYYVAQILAETGEKLRDTFASVRFVVLLYPAESDLTPIREALERRGVEVLDYSKLLRDIEATEPLAFADGHPTPANYRIVAEALARDLQQATEE